MQHDINEMQLPESSRNQELEILSKRAFEQYFDVERFILKGEVIDNGVDYRCEIKNNGNVLGFGFNFQLKSTESISPNPDGSYSKSLETSNIEYLINNGVPSYYGFYVVQEDAFYYAFLDDFVLELYKKDSSWQKQKTHTLRFIQKLNGEAIKLIYITAMNRGITSRKINSNLAIRSSYLETDKIIIDYSGDVNSDKDIRHIIENEGLRFINECKWSNVVELHSKASQTITKSSKYNLILGLANYYLGHYYSALLFFKDAKKDYESLNVPLRNHLLFIESSVKYLLKIIKKKKYQEILETVSPDKNIEFHIKLDKALQLLREKLFKNNSQGVVEFEDVVKEILQDNDANYSVKLRAKSELLIYKYKVALQKYLVTVCELNAHEIVYGVNQNIRIDLSSILNKEFELIDNGLNNLFKEIKDSGYQFGYYYLLTNRIKLNFEKYVNISIIKIVTPPTPPVQDLSDSYQGLLNDVEYSIRYFRQIGHVENELFSQSVKFEILHFLNNEKSSIVMSEIENLVELLDVNDFRERLNFITQGGTNHQMLQKLLDDKDKDNEEINKLQSELIKMDDMERELSNGIAEQSYQINLFPIGNFNIPVQKKDVFYAELEIPQEVQAILNSFFENGIVPVINTYVFPIQEGPLQGVVEYKGIESFKNMYNIRKVFFLNQFYRLQKNP